MSETRMKELLANFIEHTVESEALEEVADILTISIGVTPDELEELGFKELSNYIKEV